MSRDHSVVSSKGMMLWFIFGLNVCVLVAAFVYGYSWLWALSVIISVMIHELYHKRQNNKKGEDRKDEC